MNWSTLNVFVTGGTGSFGKKFAEIMLRDYHPRKLVIFSLGELKQHEMRIGGFDHPSLRYFIGDVRDDARLRRAMNGADIVVHAAALKQVPACEYNPVEAAATNINGARNVVDAALDTGVQKVLALSTDKTEKGTDAFSLRQLERREEDSAFGPVGAPSTWPSSPEQTSLQTCRSADDAV